MNSTCTQLKLQAGAEEGQLKLCDQQVNRDPYADIAIEKSEKLPLQAQRSTFNADKEAMDNQRGPGILTKGHRVRED